MTATDLPAERYDVIDGLRGFALLGIIWINLSGHALPFFAMWDPTIAGGTDAINLGAWTFTEVFVEGAMRGLFSLLFGASTLLFLQLSGSGASRRDLFFKRNLWLIAFGLIHGTLLLMPGDILSTGTPGAAHIQYGDRIECRIDGFESLACPVQDLKSASLGIE